MSINNATQGSLLAAILLGTVALCVALRTWTGSTSPDSASRRGWRLEPESRRHLLSFHLPAVGTAAMGRLPSVALRPAQCDRRHPRQHGADEGRPSDREHHRCAADFWTVGWAILGALAFVNIAVWSHSVLLGFSAVAGESRRPDTEDPDPRPSLGRSAPGRPCQHRLHAAPLPSRWAWRRPSSCCLRSAGSPG